MSPVQCQGEESGEVLQMVCSPYDIQSEEALGKARERLEFGREMMLIPRNLAGRCIHHFPHLYFSIR